MTLVIILKINIEIYLKIYFAIQEVLKLKLEQEFLFRYFEYRSKKCQCMQHAQLQYDYEWFVKENINNKINTYYVLNISSFGNYVGSS